MCQDYPFLSDCLLMMMSHETMDPNIAGVLSVLRETNFIIIIFHLIKYLNSTLLCSSLDCSSLFWSSKYWSNIWSNKILVQYLVQQNIFVYVAHLSYSTCKYSHLNQCTHIIKCISIISKYKL